MKKLIHQYLSESYYVLNDYVYRYGFNVPRSSRWLCDELDVIFSMSRKKLKPYLKSWALGQNKNFNFEEFWSPKVCLYLDPVPLNTIPYAMYGVILDRDFEVIPIRALISGNTAVMSVLVGDKIY